jgi:hypothetical protein
VDNQATRHCVVKLDNAGHHDVVREENGQRTLIYARL